jgi:hypothetical protein
VDIQEAQVLSFIIHSRLGIPVPKVYSSGILNDIGFIEMKFIEGDTLHSVWSGLSKDEKRSYAEQLRQIVD